MNLLNPGESRAVTVLVGQTLYVSTTGSTTVTATSGLGISAGLIATVDGSQTFGPYALNGVITLLPKLVNCEYEVKYPTYTFIVSSAAPNDADGLPDGTIYIQTA